MEEFESPTFVLDLRNNLNRSTIATAKPNKELRVLVRPEDNPSAESVLATGRLSEDSALFHVVAVTSAGQQSHAWNWSDLQDAIRA
jgi:hypothetical protein